MAELWDAYDKNFNKIEGITFIRDQKIEKGMFHLVGEVIVEHIDKTILLMQRDKRKSQGLMWEATAGGSAIKGETALDCIKRELFEETGLSLDNFIEIEREVNENNNTLYVRHKAITNCDKNSIILQEGETVAFKWVDRKEFENMKKQGLIK